MRRPWFYHLPGVAGWPAMFGIIRAALEWPVRVLEFAGDLASLEPARVSGPSMRPTLEPGDLLAVRRVHADEPRQGQVVLAQTGHREVVKRVASVDGERVFLEGDNARSTTDVQVDRDSISGIVLVRYWPLIR